MADHQTRDTRERIPAERAISTDTDRSLTVPQRPEIKPDQSAAQPLEAQSGRIPAKYYRSDPAAGQTRESPATEKSAIVASYIDTVTSQDTSSTIVHHLGQFHVFPGMDADPIGMERVAKSQFDVARFISSHPGSIIISENVSEDHTPMRDSPMIGAAKAIFPSGLPMSFDKCTPLQREFLAEEGGDRTLYLLGQVTNIYAAVNGRARADIESKLKPLQEEYGRAFGIAVQVDPKVRSLVMDDREKACLQRTKEIAQSADCKGKSILIIFGAAHDFSDEFSSQNGFSFEKIDYSGKR